MEGMAPRWQTRGWARGLGMDEAWTTLTRQAAQHPASTFHANSQSLCCTTETNITLDVSYISIKFLKLM